MSTKDEELRAQEHGNSVGPAKAMAEVGAGRKVLLIDGDDSRQLHRALESENYHCAVFASGAEALRECEPTLLRAAILSIDLLGDETVKFANRLKELAGMGSFLPIIVVGDRARLERDVREFAGACDDFIATPVSTAELSVRLTALIERNEAQAELVRLNAELEREQERRRTLAALIVHDLRNPLSAIVGNVQLLEEVMLDNKSNDTTLSANPSLAKQCLTDLGELSLRTLSMVAGLLDVEELEEGLLKAQQDLVDVHGFVSRMPSFYKTATEARKLTLSVHCPEPLQASFDRSLIARIIENLLDNAVRYAPRKGNVVLNVMVDGADLVFEVGNDGPAIPMEERTRMFERYYRLEGRRKGARANRGLGLYFCQLAAAAHKGSIAVTERSELPACFVLRLPGCVNNSQARGQVAASPL